MHVTAVWARLPADAQPGDCVEIVIGGATPEEAAAVAVEEGLTIRPHELVPVVDGDGRLLADMAADPAEPFDPRDFERVAGGVRYRGRALA